MDEWGDFTVRYASLILWIGTVWATTPSDAADTWSRQGRSLFLDCEFKRAAHAFEKAIAAEPAQASNFFWAGKSYARLADISSPLTAPKHARKAAGDLEQAVRMDPSNEEYARELLALYVDSPEWFGGGWTRARALMEEVPIPESAAEWALDQMAAARAEYKGFSWRMREGILRTSALAGFLVPSGQSK